MRSKSKGGTETPRRVTAFFLILTFCLLSFGFSSGASIQRDEDKSALAAAGFPKFVDEYLRDYYSRHPTVAAASGMHAWDGQLEDFSSAAINDEIAAIKKFQGRLQKIPPLELGLSDLFDYQIVAS